MRRLHVPDFDLLVIGEIFVELRCKGDITVSEKFEKDIGGADIAVAAAAAKLGSAVSFISAVGRDPFHNFIRDRLVSIGINTDHIVTTQGYNGMYFCSDRHPLEREYLYHRPGNAALNIIPNMVYDDIIDNTKVVYASSELQSISKSARHTIFKALHYAHSNNVMAAYDPNLRLQRWGLDDAKESLWGVLPLLDVIFPSAPEETKALFGYERPLDVVGFLWDRGVSIVVVKNGPQGCLVGYDGKIEEFEVSREAQNAITNPTLIGSAFNGGFLHCIANGQDPFTAAEFATKVAGLKGVNGGGLQALPSSNDIH